MPKAITFDKGSKRRLQRVRWKLFEVLTLALLAAFLIAVTILVMDWELQRAHPRPVPTKIPQIKRVPD